MISQRKIAESLGMPTSTVANILNGTPYYKKETRERVLQAAAALGYKPNRASIAIKRGRSNQIGVVHFGSSYGSAQQAISFLVQIVTEHGYNYSVIDQRWHSGNVRQMLSELIESRVEGMILIGSGSREETFEPESLAVLQRAGVPVVSLYGDDYLDVPLVGDSAKSSFCAMTKHLLSIGHQSILLPALPSGERSTLGRIEGMKLAFENVGQCEIFLEKDFNRVWPKMRRQKFSGPKGIIVRMEMERYDHDLVRANYELAKRLFASGASPDAFMCVNDRAACGVFNAAYEMKVNIPGDVAVTGADDEDFGSFPMYRLTTIRMDIKQSSRAAVEMLVRLLKGKSLGLREVSFPAELVLRQSCGRIAGVEENSGELPVRVADIV